MSARKSERRIKLRPRPAPADGDKARAAIARVRAESEPREPPKPLVAPVGPRGPHAATIEQMTAGELLRHATSFATGDAVLSAPADMLEAVEDDLEVLWNAMRADDADQYCAFVTRLRSRIEVAREIIRREMRVVAS